MRTNLLERGVKFDLHYVGDTLWNLHSPEKERGASFNRIRGTVDIDFGTLAGLQGLAFHATAVWQGGGNLGTYLGLVANPSTLASMNTFRLDSWWFEKRWFKDRLATRIGQFAGQDTYGHQNFGKSFVFEPIGSGLDNLFTDFEAYDPVSTSAFEIRAALLHNLYVRSMVEAEDRSPFANNSTGLVPQFRGTPVSISEIGFTPGKKATATVPKDNVDSRKGYSGLYQFGASYDPGEFLEPARDIRQSGNFLLYCIASQAVWRVDSKDSKGLDATFAYDWSPPRANTYNKTFTGGLRFNEPLPMKIHHTLSFGYVQTNLSKQFLIPGSAALRTERGFELNSLLHIFPVMYVQPTFQYYSDVAGGSRRAVVFGFRTKIEL